MFLKLAAILLFFVLFSLGTIECQRKNHSPNKKTRKFKRDFSSDSSEPIDNNHHYHNTNYFGYQQDDYRWADHLPAHYPLLFPPGTKISLTPAISIPLTHKMEMPPFQVATRIDASVPITLTIKPMKDPERSMIQKTGFLDGFNPFSSKLESNRIVLQQPRLLSRKSRDVNGTPHILNRNTRRCQSKSFLDRRTILQKMEMLVISLLESERDHPKMCLLRWACELHEKSDMAGYYGLLGEAAMLVLSVQELSKGCERSTNPHLEYLVPYIEAEIAGKARECDTFKKKCSQSIFAR